LILKNIDVSKISKINKSINNDSSNNNLNLSNFSHDRNTNNMPRNNMNQQNKLPDNKINVLPSQKNILQKESIILSIETKLYTLQQEKDKVNINI